MFFDAKFLTLHNFNIYNPISSRASPIFWKPCICSFKKNTNEINFLSPSKCLENKKRRYIYLRIDKCFIAGLGQFFGSELDKKIGVLIREKKTSKTRNCWVGCTHTLSQDVHKPDWYQDCWRYNHSCFALISSFAELEDGVVLTSGL